MPFTIPTDQTALQRFVARRHPDYVAKRPDWVFQESTYEGGTAWIRANVDRYLKEDDRGYQDRVNRAYTFPHTKEVVDLLMKYIFKSDVSRSTDSASPAVKAFWARATLSGLSIDQFMRLVCIASSVFGKVWVFVDSTKTAAVQSVADAKAAKVKAYAYVVKPYDVLDMGFAEDGTLDWVKVREHYRDDSDPFASSGVMKVRYRLWTRDSWYLFTIKRRSKGGASTDFSASVDASLEAMWAGATAASGRSDPGTNASPPDVAMARMRANPNVIVELQDQGENALGRVPCFPVDHVIGDNRYSSPGLIDSIARSEKKVLNYLSLLDAVLQDQTFSQLAMPAQGLLPGDDAYDKLMEMGTKRIFIYDGEGLNNGPQYLSPDVKQGEFILIAINKIIGEIYHSIGMGGERTKSDNTVGTDDSSGVAKAYDFERLNSLLTTKSAALQNAEGSLIELVEAWAGNKDFEADPDAPLVKYSDTFDVRSLMDCFHEAENLLAVEAPDTVRREQMRQVVRKLFPTASSKLRTEFEADLKEWPPAPPVPTVTLAATGQPGGDKAAIQSKPGGATPPAAGKTPTRAPRAASRNRATANRQGQVTSETSK